MHSMKLRQLLYPKWVQSFSNYILNFLSSVLSGLDRKGSDFCLIRTLVSPRLWHFVLERATLLLTSET